MNIWEIATNYYQYFLRGTRTTILISLFTVFCGSILGCLIAFMRLSKFKPLEKFASIYITVIRGTPMLVQLYIVYYQLDFISYPTGTLFGVDLERALPCIIALSINSSAYVAEIIRAGIQAVDKGQMEGARSCGMTNAQAMRYVVMPQAGKNILLRRQLGRLCGRDHPGRHRFHRPWTGGGRAKPRAFRGRDDAAHRASAGGQKYSPRHRQ